MGSLSLRQRTFRQQLVSVRAPRVKVSGVFRFRNFTYKLAGSANRVSIHFLLGKVWVNCGNTFGGLSVAHDYAVRFAMSGVLDSPALLSEFMAGDPHRKEAT